MGTHTTVRLQHVGRAHAVDAGMLTEIKVIPAFEEYGADRDGGIWRIVPRAALKARRKSSTVWNPYRIHLRLKRNGYLAAVLSCNGKIHHTLVHRLVLMAWVGEAPVGHEAAHSNGVRTDNCVDNLSRKTTRENARDRIAHGTQTRGTQVNTAKMTSADVEWIRAYPPAPGMFAAMARRLQLTKSVISKAYYGENWKHVAGAHAH
jgi:HNH endonuclease